MIDMIVSFAEISVAVICFIIASVTTLSGYNPDTLPSVFCMMSLFFQLLNLFANSSTSFQNRFLIYWTIFAPMTVMLAAGRITTAASKLIVISRVVSFFVFLFVTQYFMEVLLMLIAHFVAGLGALVLSRKREEDQRLQFLRVRAVQSAEETTFSLLSLFIHPYIIPRFLDGYLVADFHDCITVMQINIVNFSRTAAQLTASKTFLLLDSVFLHCEELASQYNLYRLYSFADQLTIVGGIPNTTSNHELKSTACGCAISDACSIINMANLEEDLPIIQYRIGIASGSVLLGVLTERCPRLLMWGDPVQRAQFLERKASPLQVHIDSSTVFNGGLQKAFDLKLSATDHAFLIDVSSMMTGLNNNSDINPANVLSAETLSRIKASRTRPGYISDPTTRSLIQSRRMNALQAARKTGLQAAQFHCKTTAAMLSLGQMQEESEEENEDDLHLG